LSVAIATNPSAAERWQGSGSLGYPGGNLKLTGAKVTKPPNSNHPSRYAIVLNDARITLSVFPGVKTAGAVSATGVSHMA
jgi:hypothetical protein